MIPSTVVHRLVYHKVHHKNASATGICCYLQPMPGSATNGFSRLPQGTLRVLQFTDMHLYREPDTRLLGLNTLQSFRACLDLARRQHWPADLILATGDLVHDGSAEGYRRLRGIFEDLGVPVHATAGNHDDSETLQRELKAADGPLVVDGQLLTHWWQIILLDSRLPGSEAGELTPAQLTHLDQCLSEYPERHALVCLHHPPLEVGSQWMDTMRLRNPEAFFGILDRHPQVRAVLWGHIHQEFHAQRNGVPLIASPSTCIQFKPKSTEFALDRRPPGYRWLTLHPDGGFDTGVARLPEVPADIDFESHGY